MLLLVAQVVVLRVRQPSGSHCQATQAVPCHHIPGSRMRTQPCQAISVRQSGQRAGIGSGYVSPCRRRPRRSMAQPPQRPIWPQGARMTTRFLSRQTQHAPACPASSSGRSSTGDSSLGATALADIGVFKDRSGVVRSTLSAKMGSSESNIKAYEPVHCGVDARTQQSALWL